MLFRSGTGRLLPVTTTAAANVVAHATLADDGRIRVIVVNKELSRPVVATIQVGERFRAGSVRRLKAPQATAKEGVTYADAAVGADGRWLPPSATEKELAVRDGRVTVELPAASALVLTLK